MLDILIDAVMDVLKLIGDRNNIKIELLCDALKTNTSLTSLYINNFYFCGFAAGKHIFYSGGKVQHARRNIKSAHTEKCHYACHSIRQKKAGISA